MKYLRHMGKIQLTFIALAVLLFASCSSNRYAATGPYESDEVYYTSDENYISDFALVDDIGTEVSSENQSQTENGSESGDDYYTPPSENGNVTNNYYGNVNQSPWMNSPGYWNSGFGGYNFGSHWNNWGPTVQLGWSPWSGWYSGFSYNWGWNCGWNNGWGNNGWGNNGWWNSPFYDPWGWNNGFYGYNPWGWNPYCNTPFNYYNPGFYNNGFAWNNGGWFNDSNNNGFVFGPRTPIAVTNSVNSTYTDDVFYNGTKEEPGFTGTMNNGQTFDPVTPANGQNPISNTNVATQKPVTGGELNGVKPQLNPTVGNGVISVNDQPEISTGTNSPFKPSNNSKPSSTGSMKPAPSYTLDRPSAVPGSPSSKPGGSGSGFNGIYNEPARESKPSQPERIRMNEPVRTKEPVQPQREQRKPLNTQPPATMPQREKQPQQRVTPSNQEPQRRDSEINKSRPQESRPAPSINRSNSPSRSAPSAPSSPSKSGGGNGGGGSTPRRK